MSSSSATTNHQRRSSRSNSTSSSVATVKKAASISSRSGSRTPHLKPRATSPERPGPQLTSTTPSSAKTGNYKGRPTSAAENKQVLGNANINRWSHSTASSTTALDSEQVRDKRSSPSRRMSVGPVNEPKAGQSLNQSAGADRHPGSMQSAKRGSEQADALSSRLPHNPPRIDTLPLSSLQSWAPATPSTGSATPLTADILSTSTPLTGPHDYFDETWKARSSELKFGLDSSKTVAVQYTIASPQTKKDLSLQNRLGDRQQTSNMDLRPSAQSQASPGGGHGHTRHREASTKGSTDTAAGSSISSTRTDQSRSRGHRSPTQKAMLSKALAKANTAVQLDNAQNCQGAMEAYIEACELLQQVMLRSFDADDRKKLSTIRTTYTNRISELQELDEPITTQIEKELPEMPPEEDSRDAYYEEDLPIMTSDHSRIVNGISIPPRLESMLPSTIGNGGASAAATTYRTDHATSDSKSATRAGPAVQTDLLAVRQEFVVPPLSPRRPSSPHTPQTFDTDSADTPIAETGQKAPIQHARDGSPESTSWLDTIDESVSSASSSQLSSLDFRPGIGGNLVDEIDAALNAGFDAVYQDDQDLDTKCQFQSREEQRSDDSRRQTASNESQQDSQPFPAFERSEEQHRSAESYLNDDAEAEEEERLLDEMTRGYVFDDFSFDKRSKSALPRQSDSSGFSGRTWESSVASTTHTSGTALSTLAEAVEKTPKPKVAQASTPLETSHPPYPVPVSTVAIPPIPSMPPPPKPASRPPSMEKAGVRERRMSGQNATQLKIETNRRPSTSSQTRGLQPATVTLPTIQIPSLTEEVMMPPIPHQGLVVPPLASTLVTAPLTPMTSIHSGDSLASESPATSGLTNGGSQGSIDESGIVPGMATRLHGKMMPPTPIITRKNTSSSSLKMKNLSVITGDTMDSPITPGSASFSEGRKGYPAVPAIPTPTGNTTLAGQSIGGMSLFDEHIGTPNTPRTPRSLNMRFDLPVTLERCPESFLLRPFWLMRCLYQCIAHPRGGYITTKLFLPRDIWRVKNVKLKAVDEKISQCDLLTAALLKIAKVDNLDADAVLEELQSFEAVIEQARAFLQKKLGGDVGVSGSSSLFKGSPSGEMAPESLDSRPSNTTSAAKSFASGWRKLRSKSSGAGINASYSVVPNKDTAGSSISMPTLPMTFSSSTPSSRQAVRRIPPNAINLANMGMNANYMHSLARLFDAVQVIDQVARQVEDPGLKYSSKTHVGLELSVRSAAEFFAFYILRFVLGDIGTLLDKFVKRGGEWVMS